MRGAGKRKSRGGTEVTPKSRKRKTAAAAIPTRKEGSPPNSDIDEPQPEDIIKLQLESESKRREGGGDHRMKTRLRRRLVIAGTEESAPQIIEFIVDPNPVKVEQPVDPEKENLQPELTDDFTDQDLTDPDIDVGEVKHVPHPALPEDKFTHEDEEVDGLDSNRILDEVETPSADSNRGNAAHSTSEPSDSDARVGQTECGNDTGLENNNNNWNISTDTNAQHEGTIRLEDGHVGDGTIGIGSQHIAGGTTATEPETLSIAPDIEGNVDEAPSGGMQAATDHIELLHQKVVSKNARNQESTCKINPFEDEDQNIGVECEVLKEELEEARSENETLQRKLHTKRVDLARQTGRAKILEEEQRRLLQENSRTVERLEEELKKKTNLFKNAISDRDALIVRQADETGRLKEEIEQLNTENERQACENKRLQKDNADLRRLITEKDKVIQKRTVEIEGLQEDWKILEDASKGHKTALDEATRKIAVLQNAISEKDSELTIFRARYLRDQEKNSKLHLAAKEGDEESVKKLIQLGADVSARNDSSETPIILAASSGRDRNATIKIVKCLIENGVNVFATDGAGQTFLHKVTSNENPPTSSQFHDISTYLVSKNIASLFNIRDTDNGTTPFMMAARNLNLDMATISLLQTNGVNVNLIDDRGRSFLFYAAEGKLNSKLLADADSNGNGIIKHKNLAQAINDQDEDSVYLLVNLGADVNKTLNRDSETPLHLAARSSNKAFSMSAIKLLVESGANVDARDTYESIFLHKLFNYGGYGTLSPSQFHELAAFLISKDLSRVFNAPEGSYSPLHQAVKYGEIEGATLSLLKDNGVDFNAVDDVGSSILNYAIMGNRTLRLISDLVAIGGANPNPQPLSGDCNSMHIAAENGRVDLLKFFLDHGLDVNARGSWGHTPLHRAIYSRENAIEAVQFLLRNGANPDIVNDDGKSPRDIVNEKRLNLKSDSVSVRVRIPDAEQIATSFSLGSSC